MAQAADLVINDGSATPVAITFKVVKASPVLSVFKDRRLAKPSFWPELTLSADLPASNATVHKAEIRVGKPVVDSVTQKVTDIGRVRTIFDFPTSMTAAERNDLYAFHVNALSNSLVRGAIRDLDPVVG